MPSSNADVLESSQKLAGPEGPFQRPSLFRQVTGAIGRDPLRQAGIHLVQEALGNGRNRLSAPPRLDEGNGPDP